MGGCGGGTLPYAAENQEKEVNIQLQIILIHLISMSIQIKIYARIDNQILGSCMAEQSSRIQIQPNIQFHRARVHPDNLSTSMNGRYLNLKIVFPLPVK